MRENINDLFAFIAVATDRKFTSSAAMVMSPLSLSRTIRKLDTGLEVRLLIRTTRSASSTQAGERLLGSVVLHLAEIEAEMAALGELRSKPAGTVRIVSSEYAANSIRGRGFAPASGLSRPQAGDHGRRLIRHCRRPLRRRRPPARASTGT